MKKLVTKIAKYDKFSDKITPLSNIFEDKKQVLESEKQIYIPQEKTVFGSTIFGSTIFGGSSGFDKFTFPENPQHVEKLTKNLKSGVQAELLDSIMKDKGLQEAIVKNATKFMDSGCQMGYGVYPTKRGHCYEMGFNYDSKVHKEIAEKDLVALQMLLIHNTPGARSYVMTEESYATNFIGWGGRDSQGNVELPGECLDYLVNPERKKNDDSYKYAYLLGADEIRLRIPKPVRIFFEDRSFDVLFVEATTMFLRHTLFGQLMHIILFDRDAQKLCHYWFGAGSAPTVLDRDVMALQDVINNIVAPMWLIAASNSNFLGNYHHELDIKSVIDFSGKIKDQDKSVVSKFFTGEYSHFPNASPVLKLMGEKGYGWLSDANQAHNLLVGKRSVKRILPHVTVFWNHKDKE